MPFKFNLQRYSAAASADKDRLEKELEQLRAEADAAREAAATAAEEALEAAKQSAAAERDVGPYKLNSVDP